MSLNTIGLRLQDFEILKEIGSGSFSSVLQVKWIKNNELYVLKKIQAHLPIEKKEEEAPTKDGGEDDSAGQRFQKDEGQKNQNQIEEPSPKHSGVKTPPAPVAKKKELGKKENRTEREKEKEIVAKEKERDDNSKKPRHRSNYNSVKREVEMMERCKGCPQIVQYYGAFYEGGYYYLILEYISGGNLLQLFQNHIQRKTYIREKKLWTIFSETCLALKDLAARGIVHRDIKCQNIMYTEKGEVKLVDLGFACLLANNKHLSERCGTPFYMPPEMINKELYDAKADIWSLGCVMYILAQLRAPFNGADLPELCTSILEETPVALNNTKYSTYLSKLIYSMLTKDRQQRPSIDVLINLNEKYVQQFVGATSTLTSTQNQLAIHNKTSLSASTPQNNYYNHTGIGTGKESKIENTLNRKEEEENNNNGNNHFSLLQNFSPIRMVYGAITQQGQEEYQEKQEQQQYKGNIEKGQNLSEQRLQKDKYKDEEEAVLKQNAKEEIQMKLLTRIETNVEAQSEQKDFSIGTNDITERANTIPQPQHEPKTGEFFTTLLNGFTATFVNTNPVLVPAVESNLPQPPNTIKQEQQQEQQPTLNDTDNSNSKNLLSTSTSNEGNIHKSLSPAFHHQSPDMSHDMNINMNMNLNNGKDLLTQNTMDGDGNFVTPNTYAGSPFYNGNINSNVNMNMNNRGGINDNNNFFNINVTTPQLNSNTSNMSNTGPSTPNHGSTGGGMPIQKPILQNHPSSSTSSFYANSPSAPPRWNPSESAYSENSTHGNGNGNNHNSNDHHLQRQCNNVNLPFINALSGITVFTDQLCLRGNDSYGTSSNFPNSPSAYLQFTHNPNFETINPESFYSSNQLNVNVGCTSPSSFYNNNNTNTSIQASTSSPIDQHLLMEQQISLTAEINWLKQQIHATEIQYHNRALWHETNRREKKKNHDNNDIVEVDSSLTKESSSNDKDAAENSNSNSDLQSTATSMDDKNNVGSAFELEPTFGNEQQTLLQDIILLQNNLRIVEQKLQKCQNSLYQYQNHNVSISQNVQNGGQHNSVQTGPSSPNHLNLQFQASVYPPVLFNRQRSQGNLNMTNINSMSNVNNVHNQPQQQQQQDHGAHNSPNTMMYSGNSSNSNGHGYELSISNSGTSSINTHVCYDYNYNSNSLPPPFRRNMILSNSNGNWNGNNSNNCSGENSNSNGGSINISQSNQSNFSLNTTNAAVEGLHLGLQNQSSAMTNTNTNSDTKSMPPPPFLTNTNGTNKVSVSPKNSHLYLPSTLSPSTHINQQHQQTFRRSPGKRNRHDQLISNGSGHNQSPQSPLSRRSSYPSASLSTPHSPYSLSSHSSHGPHIHSPAHNRAHPYSQNSENPGNISNNLTPSTFHNCNINHTVIGQGHHPNPQHPQLTYQTSNQPRYQTYSNPTSYSYVSHGHSQAHEHVPKPVNVSTTTPTTATTTTNGHENHGNHGNGIKIGGVVSGTGTGKGQRTETEIETPRGRGTDEGAGGGGGGSHQSSLGSGLKSSRCSPQRLRDITHINMDEDEDDTSISNPNTNNSTNIKYTNRKEINKAGSGQGNVNLLHLQKDESSDDDETFNPPLKQQRLFGQNSVSSANSGTPTTGTPTASMMFSNDSKILSKANSSKMSVSIHSDLNVTENYNPTAF